MQSLDFERKEEIEIFMMRVAFGETELNSIEAKDPKYIMFFESSLCGFLHAGH